MKNAMEFVDIFENKHNFITKDTVPIKFQLGMEFLRDDDTMLRL
jgi:hypothetical protein